MIRRQILQYASRTDATSPLFAEAFWKQGCSNLPLVVIMPGFTGSRLNVIHDCRRFAEKEVCALAVDMRGRGQSSGEPDCGLIEIHDILDAVDCAGGFLKGVVDPNRCHIVGYSGGGGNVLSAITMFPDRFQVAVSFFGISDYSFWYLSGAVPHLNRIMDKWIGGPPEVFPNRYRVRNSINRAGNCLQTKVYLFWDEEETICPPVMNEIFASSAYAQGHRKIVCCVSHKNDINRWKHGYTFDNQALIAAEDIFWNDILTR